MFKNNYHLPQIPTQQRADVSEVITSTARLTSLIALSRPRRNYVISDPARPGYGTNNCYPDQPVVTKKGYAVTSGRLSYLNFHEHFIGFTISC